LGIQIALDRAGQMMDPNGIFVTQILFTPTILHFFTSNVLHFLHQHLHQPKFSNLENDFLEKNSAKMVHILMATYIKLS